MSNLPKELISEILSLLPVRLLLMLRLVCKPWRDLVDSPTFVTLHRSRGGYRHVIFRDEHLHSVGFDSVGRGSVLTVGKIKDHPLSCQDYRVEVWGSCNGLLCLVNSLDTIAVWNFSTRKSRKLPYAPIEFKDLKNYVETRIYGFGYDKSGDDYKVVRIVMLKNKNLNIVDNEVKVYSLKSHSWHRVQKFPKYPNLKRTVGVLAGGCLHWIVTEGFFSRKGGMIIAFDLEREVFGSIEQPESTDKSFVLQLHCLEGCLTMTHNYYLDHLDIWVMKEYGVKDSWTKLVSITQMGLPSPVLYMHPIIYSNSGKELLFEQDADKLVWYNMEKKTMKTVKLKGIRGLMQVDLSVESLISLDVVDRCQKRPRKKDERNMDNFLSKGFKLAL